MCFIMSTLIPHLPASVQQTADHGLSPWFFVLRCFTVLSQPTTKELICPLERLMKNVLGGDQHLNWFCKLVHSKAIILYQTSTFTVLSELKHFQGVLKHNILGQSCKGQILKRNMYLSLVGRRRWHWWLISENHSHTSLLKPLFLGAEYSFQVQ